MKKRTKMNIATLYEKTWGKGSDVREETGSYIHLIITQLGFRFLFQKPRTGLNFPLVLYVIIILWYCLYINKKKSKYNFSAALHLGILEEIPTPSITIRNKLV